MKRLLFPLLLLLVAFASAADPVLGLKITQMPLTMPIPYCIDPDGGLWGVQGGGGRDVLNQLKYAKNDTSTWSTVYTFPDENGSKVIVRYVWMNPKTRTLLVGVYNNVHYQLHRSSDLGKTWTMVMDFPDGSSVIGRDNITFNTFGDIFITQYHSDPLIPTGNDSVFRSRDDGKTFQPTLTVPFPTVIRHFHQVYVDPYNPATVYALAGDTDVQSKIYYSTDRGDNWQVLVTGHEARAVAIGFSPDELYWGTDQGPLDRYEMFYSRTVRQVVARVPFANQFFWMNQNPNGLSVIARSNEIGYPCNIYTLAFGQVKNPSTGQLEPNHTWKRVLTWVGEHNKRYRSEFNTSNVGAAGQYYVYGLFLEASATDNARLLKIEPYLTNSGAADAKSYPLLRPRRP